MSNIKYKYKRKKEEKTQGNVNVQSQQLKQIQWLHIKDHTCSTKSCLVKPPNVQLADVSTMYFTGASQEQWNMLIFEAWTNSV